MPSFKLHKYVSAILVEKNIDYRTGVVYSTNRRVWEHDKDFKKYLKKESRYNNKVVIHRQVHLFSIRRIDGGSRLDGQFTEQDIGTGKQ